VEPVSVSQVNAYLACPLKYRFQYVERIPPPWRPAALAFGGSVHAALEHFHKERLAGRQPTAEEVVAIFEADWYAANLAPLVFSEKDSKESLKEKGKDLVRLYANESNGAAPTSVEERFEIDLVDPETGEILDVKLRGAIDLVEEGDVLVETKTAARSLEQGGLERNLQLSTYALAFLLTRGPIPRLRLDPLLKTKTPRLERRETTRTAEDLGWTAQLIASVARAIASGHFFPNPSWRCTECEYFAHCQAWRGAA
jgi:putative RecB family exonuclease